MPHKNDLYDTQDAWLLRIIFKRLRHIETMNFETYATLSYETGIADGQGNMIGVLMISPLSACWLRLLVCARMFTDTPELISRTTMKPR
jgi:hypothetical protein